MISTCSWMVPLLSRLTEAESASLHFELRSRKQSDEVLAKNDSTVELLARNQWGGIGHLPEMVAAFVQPNDQAIDRLLKGAALALQTGGKSGSIDGYTHGSKRAWELASGIWAAVLRAARLRTATRQFRTHGAEGSQSFTGTRWRLGHMP